MGRSVLGHYEGRVLGNEQVNLTLPRGDEQGVWKGINEQGKFNPGLERSVYVVGKGGQRTAGRMNGMCEHSVWIIPRKQ